MSIKELSRKDAPVLKVDHRRLRRFNKSDFVSHCPICRHGTITIRFDGYGMTMNTDTCWFCGQRVEYTDVKKFDDIGRDDDGINQHEDNE